YEEARKVKPRDLPVLFKLLGIYQRLPRWAQAFDVLSSVAEADTDPTRRSKTFFTMAQIAKDELADRGTALSLYEKALDVDPSHLVGVEPIVQLLTADRDWLGLDQMYRRMITRVQQTADRTLLHALCKQLALIQRDRLGHTEEAIVSIRTAVQVLPSDEESQA